MVHCQLGAMAHGKIDEDYVEDYISSKQNPLVPFLESSKNAPQLSLCSFLLILFFWYLFEERGAHRLSKLIFVHLDPFHLCDEQAPKFTKAKHKTLVLD